MNSNKLYTRLLWYTVITIWILLALHLSAMKFYLYWVFDWFDIVMHGLGGLVVGFFMTAILVKLKPVLKEHLGLLVFLCSRRNYLYWISLGVTRTCARSLHENNHTSAKRI